MFFIWYDKLFDFDDVNNYLLHTWRLRCLNLKWWILAITTVTMVFCLLCGNWWQIEFGSAVCMPTVLITRPKRRLRVIFNSPDWRNFRHTLIHVDFGSTWHNLRSDPYIALHTSVYSSGRSFLLNQQFRYLVDDHGGSFLNLFQKLLSPKVWHCWFFL